ncbi:MAG: hypothetical protein L0241_22090, partial [Planctomycetia bacterium]|nr:hypothetical protein [Planctomycetia bacterium]
TAEGQRAIKTAELDRFEFYDLEADAGETTDLASRESERLKEMAVTLRALYQNVRVECPTWPEFDFTTYNYESPRIEWPSYRKRPARP